MPGHVLLEDDDLALVRVSGDDVYVERSRFDRAATIFRIAPGMPAHPIAQLPAGRPRGVLQAVEDDALICLEADGTLAAISLRGSRRLVLRRLAPAPAAIALTPEHVVWCSSDTQMLDGGRGPEVPGEVWRWRRGTEHVEQLGGHDSFRPDLAVAPPPAPQLAPDVYVGADRRLGVVVGGGLRWLADEAQGVGHLACDPDAVFYVTGGSVKRRDRASGAARVVWSAPIPLALAVHGRTLVVGRNAVAERGAVHQESAVIAVDLDTGAGAVLGLAVGRPAALAANAHGVFAIEEPALGEARRSRLVFYPWSAPPISVLPAPPPYDLAAWVSPLQLQWWSPDDRAGHFQIDVRGAWACTGAAGTQTGAVEPAAWQGLLAQIQRWREGAEPAVTGWVDLRQQRGWLVVWGVLAWHRAAGARDPEAAQAVARLLELLARACRPLAAVVREGL